MAGALTDMEELLERIASAEVKSFMREALACYSAGAYRACIVLSFIAVFEDLRAKVRAAAPLNADAKVISTAIETLAAGQKPFETDLVNRMKSKKLLTELQAQQLIQIIDRRNKAAHPSGHHASAEEARFVFFEAINEFLSKPLLGAKEVANVLIGRLGDANFFPSNAISTIKAAVTDEIDQLNPAAFPYLVVQVVDRVLDTDAFLAQNAKYFLTGMAALRKEVLRAEIARVLLKGKAADLKYGEAIAEAITADPQVLKGADGVTQARIRKVLSKVVDDTTPGVSVSKLVHPIAILRSMAKELDVSDVSPVYDEFVVAVVKKFWASPELMPGLKLGGSARAIILKELMDRAGSSEFSVANLFARALPDLQKGLAEELEPAEALALLAAVGQAADGGAWAASALRGSKFASLPDLRSVVSKFIDAFPSEADVVLGNNSAATFKAQHLTDPADEEVEV